MLIKIESELIFVFDRVRGVQIQQVNQKEMQPMLPDEVLAVLPRK